MPVNPIEFDLETTGLQPWSQRQFAFLYIFLDGDAQARLESANAGYDAVFTAENEGVHPAQESYEAIDALQDGDEKWGVPVAIPYAPTDEQYAALGYLAEDPDLQTPEVRAANAARIQEWFDRAIARGAIRAWNSNFDRSYAEVGGFKVPGDGQWHDGMLDAQSIDERRSVALKAIAGNLFGDAATDPQKAVKEWLTNERKRRVKAAKDDGTELVEPDYSDVPRRLMEPYGLEDVILTRRVCDHYKPVLDDNPDLAKLVAFERSVMDSLFAVQKRGLPAREDNYRKLEQEVLSNLEVLDDKIAELVPPEVKDFNAKSSAKIIEAIKARGANMQYMEKEGGEIKSADADNLRAVDDELALTVLKFRSEYKVLSTYVRPMLGRTYKPGMRMWKEPFIAPDGRIHANYRQVGARTGRLSCSDPNVQNQPRDDLRLRYCIAADPGHKIVAVDLKNIEMVLFAAYAGEGRLLDAVQAGEDLHLLTAKMLGLRDRKRADGNMESARQLGKGAPVDTPLLTPTGWSTYGTISVGDDVVGADGTPTRVTGVFPRGVLPTYKITFSDGVTAVVDTEHLWSVRTPSQVGRNAPWSVKSTEELYNEQHKEWRIPLVKPVEFAKAEPLPFDPYMFGVMLGDGCFRAGYPSFASGDAEIIEYARMLANESGLNVKQNEKTYGYRVVGKQKVKNKWKETFRNLGLDGKYSYEKHIPEEYLRSSISDRHALLQGIMDTDGYAIGPSGAGITLTSAELTNGVIELARSLGGVAHTTKRKCYLNGRRHRDAYRTRLRLPQGMSPFRLTRKQLSDFQRTTVQRNIRKIELHTPQEIICISVEAEDSLYVSSDYLVTHNTYNFSRVYGGGLRTIRKSFRCKMDEARRLKQLFDNAYPEVRNLSNRIEYRLHDQGYISDKLISGRRFRVAERDAFKATNYLVQGTAAALFKKALMGMHAEDIPVVALVHDEVLAHVPEALAKETEERLKFHLTNHPALTEVVPLGADGDICDRWSDAKPLKDGSLFVPNWAKVNQ